MDMGLPWVLVAVDPGGTVNKTELIKALSRRADLPQREVTAVVEALFDPFDGVLADTLARGESVAIRGFGTFEPRVRAPRLARNPRSGEPVQLPAQVRPALRASERLVERLNS